VTPSLFRLSAGQPDFEQRLDERLAIAAGEDDAVDSAVASIIADVRARGDAAVLEYTRRFDQVSASRLSELEVSIASCGQALNRLTRESRQAIQIAADRIRSYHTHQRDVASGTGYTYADEYGSLLGQKITPLDRVGIYVPGGKAAYPSSVLMNAFPAQVAGVSQIVMVVPAPGGVMNDLVLAAAGLAGVTRIFAIGGAQAVAALAYGTETVPAVDKIVGPGNAYVAAAKRRVFGRVGIDMIAGPSEILVLCDGTTDPEWVAMDLFSQAEHDELAQSILVCPHADYLDRVEAAVWRLLPGMKRQHIIRTSMENRAALIKVRDMEEACSVANRIAPEHLEISAENPAYWADRIRHAGAIFLGRFTSEALGDYCAGPNHVLPTSGTARFSSPLGVYDFQKRSSIIQVSKEGAQALGKVAVALAENEGLEAHGRSAAYRMEES
jgi:histidinol dehydrogenase